MFHTLYLSFTFRERFQDRGLSRVTDFSNTAEMGTALPSCPRVSAYQLLLRDSAHLCTGTLHQGRPELFHVQSLYNADGKAILFISL